MQLKPSIPIYNLHNKAGLPEFEIMPWQKEISRYDIATPHRHNYFEILLFTKGGGVHEIDFHRYPVKSNSIHFVSANRVHEVRRTPGSDGFTLLFAQEFLPDNYALRDFEFYKPGAYPLLNLAKKEFSEMKILFDNMQREYFGNAKKRREILQSLLRVFLLKSQRWYEDKMQQSPPKSKVTGKFTEKLEPILEKHFHQHWRANDYARELNMSVTHLNTVCKQYYSRSTETIIQDRLIIEIKRLLVYTNKTVKEICYELNFDDPAYFTRFFKKKTKVTPLEYRNAVNK